MARIDVLKAAIAKQQAAVDRLEAVPDSRKTPKQWKALATDQRSLVAYLTELAGTLTSSVTSDSQPAGAGLFTSLGDGVDTGTVFIHGGAANGNPDGPDWTEGDARRWFEYVWSNNVGYHNVAPVLLPGSHVLTPEGLAFAQGFQQKAGLDEAPRDFNPLNLTLIP